MPNILRASQYKAFTDSSAKFTNPMQPGQLYRFVATQDCWVYVGATGGSAAAQTANNHLYIKGQVIFLHTHDATNGYVHMVRVSTSGDATLSVVEGTG